LAKISKINFNTSQIKLIMNYYSNWEHDPSVDLKFRFVKILAYNQEDSDVKWIYLNRLINKRRLNYKLLKFGLNRLLNEGFVPNCR
jgi:hypothetical protein